LGGLRFRCCDTDPSSWSSAGRPTQNGPSYRRLRERERERLSFGKCDLRHTRSGLWRTVQIAPAMQLTRFSGIRCASYRLTSVTVVRRTTLTCMTGGCGTISRLTMIDLW